MKWNPTGALLMILAAFLGGFLSHALYRRWTAPAPQGQVYPVTFLPLPSPPTQVEIPLVRATDLDKMRRLVGAQIRVKGRIYRVGHSAKSNTYFLNFGPSRSSFTGVVFSSTAEIFERRRVDLRNYEGKEVELMGEVRDHPQYGLEMILEDPSQIRVLD